jgi:hypothetical protein
MSLTKDVDMTILCVWVTLAYSALVTQIIDIACVCDDARYVSCAPDVIMWSTYRYSQNSQRPVVVSPWSSQDLKNCCSCTELKIARICNLIKLLEFKLYSNNSLLIKNNINHAKGLLVGNEQDNSNCFFIVGLLLCARELNRRKQAEIKKSPSLSSLSSLI